MRLIVDARLPKRLARWLAARGHDALHTLDLPQSNRTPDAEIIDFASREHRIVVTKDGDFVASHLLRRRPRKLLWITTGNMSNAELEAIIEQNLKAIEASMRTSDFVGLSRNSLIVHG